ncbi:MAG: OmpH family outer membrane protein [Desulfobacterales bacterium]|nr:MAG: OmpH family outer membrane protein [Desulfobacterales bacterium]
MKIVKFGIAISILFLFYVGSFSYAADVAKIGILDLQKILETSDAGKSIQNELKSQKDKMESDLKQKGAEIENISKRLEREAMVMSKDMREEKEREQRIKINDFKSLQKRYRSELQNLEVRLMNELQDDLKKLVDAIGKKEGYLMIINKIGVLYAPSSIDITDKVIQQLNAVTAKKKKK